MPPIGYKDKNLLVWGDDIEPETLEQAARTAQLPFVEGHLALMPDAHVGIGATVGSVVFCRGAIVPAAVGVDIGCGMVASRTDLTAADLPDDLGPLLSMIEARIPAGVGKGHERGAISEPKELRLLGEPSGLRWMKSNAASKIAGQFGTLGSGNHFVEVCFDDEDRVWVVLHSGSRGIGNQLAQWHMTIAKRLMKQHFVKLPDPDLAYVVEGTDEAGRRLSRSQARRELTTASLADAMAGKTWLGSCRGAAR